MAEGPGRACPVSYRYGAKVLRAQPSIDAETLYVAGGLYGNPFALEALLAVVAGDPGAKLVFNGDFNWFDVAAEDFREVNETVLAHHATRGNVETELAQPAKDAGCGCGYPDWVGDAEVLRSNRIQERLRATALAQPGLTARLGALPMFAIARVGATRVGIVHGDADSLAGWGFSQQALATPEGLAAACDAFTIAGAGVIASSHTCLPVLQRIANGSRDSVLINNGAAGMPNFHGTSYGLVTRISVHAPSAEAIYGVCVEGTHVHAIPVRYDTAAWKRRFRDQWPSGSDAHLSYYGRICDGPAYAAADAIRIAARRPAALAL
jgi:hypothetical protein